MPSLAPHITCCLLAISLYWQARLCGFVFDDAFAVTGNADTTSDTPLEDVFLHDFWGKEMNAVDSHKSYRPLTVLTFRSDWNLSGGAHDPALSHTVNILLHGLVTALVCALACALFPGPGSGWTAFASGTLFAVHPVHVEAVVGVVSRADLIATAAFILGYLHYTTSRCSGSSAWRLWPLYAMCLYTALLAKEIGLFLVPVCMLWELCRCPLRKIRCLSYCAGLAFLAVPYLALRTYLSSHTLSLLSITSSTLQHSQLIRKAENPFAFLTGWDWIRSVNYLQAKYAQLLFFPSELCAEYSFDCIPAVVSWMDPRNALSLALNVAAVLGFAHCFVNRDGAVTSLVALVVIPYIPASNLFFVIGTLVAERLLYLPSVGFCVLMGRLWWKVCNVVESSRFSSMAPLIKVAFLIVLGFGVWQTSSRIPDWKNEQSLFESAVSVCPRSAKIHEQVAKLRQMQGNYSGMLAELDIAKEIDPTHCDLSFQYGTYYAAHPTAPDYMKAAQYFKECLTCVYENTRCLAKLQLLWKYLLAQPNASYLISVDIAETYQLLQNPDAASLYYREAGVKLWMQQRDASGAGRLLLDSLRMNPLRCDVFYWLATINRESARQSPKPANASFLKKSAAMWDYHALLCGAGLTFTGSQATEMAPLPSSLLANPSDFSWSIDQEQRARDRANDLNVLAAVTAAADGAMKRTRTRLEKLMAAAGSEKAQSALSQSSVETTVLAKSDEAVIVPNGHMPIIAPSVAVGNATLIPNAEEVHADILALVCKASVRHGEPTRIQGHQSTPEVTRALEVVTQLRQSAAVHYSRAGYAFLRAELWADSVRAFRKAIALDSPVGTVDCMANVYLASALMELGSSDRAEVIAALGRTEQCPAADSATQAQEIAAQLMHRLSEAA